MPALDTLLQNVNITESSSFVCYAKNVNETKCNKIFVIIGHQSSRYVFHDLSINKLNANYFTGAQKMNEFITRCFPESVEELHMLNDKISSEANFVQVMTKSPRFQNFKSITPVFVIPGFKPKYIKPLYEKLIYPAFEARLPEVIDSIDNVAKVLVDVSYYITYSGTFY